VKEGKEEMIWASVAVVLSLFASVLGQEDYGVDVTYPIHWGIDKNSWAGKRYEEFMEGCTAMYSHKECWDTERARLKMSRDQTASQHNYTELGFKRRRLPEHVFKLLRDFYDTNKDKQVQEKWGRGYTYTNHWSSPTFMVSVEDGNLKGSGQALKNQIWEGVRPIIEEWIGGYEIRPTSMYGIRIYTTGAMLATHVDRLPLVSSCIVNVDQDVTEPWPIEVYDHKGKAYNVTMEPGDMVLYESSTVLHGRPAPLMGSHFANIFIHFEPLIHKEMNRRDKERLGGAMNEYKEDEAYDEPEYRMSEDDKKLVLNHAAARGNLAQVRELVEKDRNSLRVADPNGWQPLHEAVRAGNTKIARYLVESGADIGARTSNGGSALWWARRTLPAGHSTIKFLEEIGAPEYGEL